MPSLNSIYEWHGIIFIRAGNYKGGVFKFLITFPLSYPSNIPEVKFLNKMYHPLVSSDCGIMDISVYILQKIEFPHWSSQYDAVSILRFIKKSFTFLDYYNITGSNNSQAGETYKINPTFFFTQVKICVDTSIENIYNDYDGRFELRVSK